MELLYIDLDLCDYCGLCAAVCHRCAVLVGPNSVEFHSAQCDDCGLCQVICARNAIVWNYEIVAAE